LWTITKWDDCDPTVQMGSDVRVVKKMGPITQK
jgi:hypothetical protein